MKLQIVKLKLFLNKSRAFLWRIEGKIVGIDYFFVWKGLALALG
jgi:hypothetical protein